MLYAMENHNIIESEKISTSVNSHMQVVKLKISLV